jgi:hypothetical protein
LGTQIPKIMKRTYLIILSCFLSLSLPAASWIGGEGYWNDPKHWDTGEIPGPGETVTIHSGHVHLKGSANVESVTIHADAVLSVYGLLTLDHSSSYSSIRIFGELYVEEEGEVVLTHGSSGNIVGMLNAGYVENHHLIRSSDGYHRGIHQTVDGKLINHQLVRVESCTYGMKAYGHTDNFGEFILSETTQSALTLHGSFRNFQELTIQNGFRGLEIYGDFENESLLTIEQVSYGGIYLFQGGSLENKSNGQIEISDILFITNSGTLENAGMFQVWDQNDYTTGFFVNSGTVVNTPTGEMWMEHFSNTAIINNQIFKSQGSIHLNVAQGNRGIWNRGTFQNLESGYLDIDHATWVGISNDANAVFLNRSDLVISHGLQLGIANEGTFQNTNDASLTIQDTPYTSLQNSPGASFLNQGSQVNLLAGPGNGKDIANSGEILNEQCGEIRSFREIENTTSGEFVNKAWLFSAYDDLHEIEGDLFNYGVIVDEFDAFAQASYFNLGIRIHQIPGTVEAGLAISDVIDLGTFNNVNFLGWYTSVQGTTSAGNFYANYNSFTPNGNAVGLSTLYIHLELDYDQSCTPLMVPVQFENPIQGNNGPRPRSITSPSERISIEVYPNPTSNLLRVEVPRSPSEQIATLVTSTGQAIRQETIPAEIDTTVEWDVHNLPSGIYSLKIEGALKGASINQVVIQH